MSINTTTPEETAVRYRTPDASVDDDGEPMKVGGQDVQVVDADSIEDPEDYDAPEAHVEIVPVPARPVARKEDGDRNPVVEYVDEHVPVNTYDETRSRFTRDEAEEMTGRILSSFWKVMEAQYELGGLISKAYEGRVWIALGYGAGMKGWVAYCNERITPQAVKLNGVQRSKIIAGMDPDTMPSLRAMAAALGVSQSTVRRDQDRAAGGRRAHRAVIRGTDGKMYRLDQLRGEDRRQAEEKIIGLYEQGYTEREIGEKLGGIAQSTINDIRRKNAARRVSQGLLTPTVAQDVTGGVLDSDEPVVDVSDGTDPADDMWATGVSDTFQDAADTLEELCEQLDDPRWQPGSPLTGRVVSKSYANLRTMLGSLSTLVTLLVTDGGASASTADGGLEAAERLEQLIGDDSRVVEVTDLLDGLRTRLAAILD